MSKLIILITCLIFIVCSLVTISNAQTNDNPPSTGTNTSKTPSVDITFDKTYLVLECPLRESFPFTREREKTNVQVLARDFVSNNLTYTYIVSGGTIVGNGSSVIWDLHNTGRETQTIRVIVNDGKGFSMESGIKTMRLTLSEPCGPPPCTCPSLVIKTLAESVNTGETITFLAKAEGGSQASIIYNWTVSNGTIVKGQGTSEIKVKTTKEMIDKTVTAEVEISGVCAECPRTASASVTVEKTKKKVKTRAFTAN